MKTSSGISLLGLLALTCVAIIGSVVSIVESNTPDNQPQRLADVATQEGISTNRIGAVGLVEPSSQLVKIGSNLSGVVGQVYVAAGSRVEKGDPLFALDRRAASAFLAQRRHEFTVAAARLQEKRAQVPALSASVQEAQANVDAVQAELNDASDLVRIASTLTAGTGITQRERTRRYMLMRKSEARLRESQAKLTRAKLQLSLYDEESSGASIAVERSLLEQARAAVAVAEINMQLGVVRAPIDGVVLQVNVRAGEFAQAGALTEPLLRLGDTTSLHVRVDIDEADIYRFQTGKTAFASVRGASAKQIPLTFLRIEPLVVPKRSLTGRSTERVDTRVLQAIYRLESSDARLFPGQLLDVFVTAQDVELRTASPEARTDD